MRLGRRYLLPSCKLLQFFSPGRGHLPFKSADAFSDPWKSETKAIVRRIALPASGTVSATALGPNDQPPNMRMLRHCG